MKSRTAGFTLLEILVALVVLGLLFASLSGGLRFGLLAVAAVGRAGAHNEDIVTADRTFRMLIEHASAGSALVDTPFRGEAHSLRFTTIVASPSGGFGSGSLDVSIEVNSGHQLVAIWRPHYNMRLAMGETSAISVLAEGVEGVDLDYEAVVAGSGRADPVWRNLWSEPGLPDLVRLHVRLRAAGEVAWPDIIADTRLQARVL